jgi:cytochrome c oxidase cbb3-type subunit IV
MTTVGTGFGTVPNRRENAMDLDVTTLRIIATLASLATFLGIAWWAYSGRNRDRFQEAARIPFEQD